MAGRGGRLCKKKAEGLRDFFIASYLKNTNFSSSVQGKKNEKITRIFLKMESIFLNRAVGNERNRPDPLSSASHLD